MIISQARSRLLDNCRESVDEYFEKLVQIEIPCKSRVDGLYLKSVCMSIESINLIVDTFIANTSELENISSRCVIYLRQIMRFYGQSKVGAFGAEKKHFEPVFKKLEYNEVDFREGRHYLLLQDVYAEEDDLQAADSKFQQNLEILLKEIQLFSYINNNKSVKPLEGLIKLTKQVMKYPEKFAKSSESVSDIQALANTLFETIEEQAITNGTLTNLATHYEDKMAFLNQQNKTVLNTLSIITKNMMIRLKHIKGRKKHLKSNIIPGLLAKMMIENEKFPFELYTNLPLEQIPTSVTS
eukprot:TRINITY_DN1638_c0_g3_i1.p1 TRINITY_DN1638_c0_g3~~TRINITY_DN1638_c0_g3_i1.p1  ORF type:complete len:297 (+),score=62.66 TRINITY_DN1638_c0_g3_i1:363-1253(+)